MFADDNFRFDESGRQLSKWVENTVGKGEIARYEQFLLFPQCFQKPYFLGASKGVVMWEWVNISQNKALQNEKMLVTSFFSSPELNWRQFQVVRNTIYIGINHRKKRSEDHFLYLMRSHGSVESVTRDDST